MSGARPWAWPWMISAIPTPPAMWPRPMRWSTKPRVVAADSGREFAFVANAVPVGDTTKWTYRLEPSGDGGTDVTESFEIVHDVPRYIVLGEKLMGIKDRKADLQANMQQSLERLKRVVEGSA